MPTTLLKKDFNVGVFLWYWTTVNFEAFLNVMKKNWTLNLEAYLKPSQTSKMELYLKIVTDFYLLTIFSKRLNLDVWQGSKYASGMSLRVTNGISLYLVLSRNTTRSTS